MNRNMRLLFLLLLPLVLLFGCSDSSGPSYSAAIVEGRRAVDEVMKESNATAVTVALTDGNRIVWSETFGVIDRKTGKAAVPSTMFGIGSVSKMLAAVGTMILVDRGQIALDEPIVTYLPGFRMLSPEYRDITVRMLLNHSSGLPGGDMRNVASPEPYTGFAADVMEALKYQRLKHAPGYMSVYCNDGFTMLDNLIHAVSGKSYPDFVKEEIFIPLGMNNTRYQTARFAEDSFAKAHEGDKPLDYISFNMYATGGLFSTAEDMSRLAAMLLNKGVFGSRRILSERAITAMAEDQTLSSFNPIPSSMLRYGLGWDSVSQPGLDAVGMKGWQKGGDINGFYGATFIVAPEEKLAVTVIGASNSFGSSKAAKIAERILLAALVERGRLAAMPPPLDKNVPLPIRTPTAEEKKACSGYYGSSSMLYDVKFVNDDTLTIKRYQDGDWKDWHQGLRLRSDGWFAGDNDSVTAVRFLIRAGRAYFAFREVSGAGHYSSPLLYGQLLTGKSPLSSVWQARLDQKWVPVNDNLYTGFVHPEVEPLSLKTHTVLPGYVFKGAVPMTDMVPQDSNRLNGMGLQIPQAFGRDLADLAVETREDQEWLRYGSVLYRPLSGVPPVTAGQSTVTIGPDGFIEWRSLPEAGTILISTDDVWKILKPDLSPLAYGKGEGSMVITGSSAKYLVLYGDPGTASALNLTAP